MSKEGRVKERVERGESKKGREREREERVKRGGIDGERGRVDK